MNFFVTGAAGFIGSHLVEALLKQSHAVTGLDNFDTFYDRSIKERNLETALNQSSFEFYEGDICDQSNLEDILNNNRFDAVIHLAAKAGVRNSLNNPISYFNVNVNGTLNLLEVMRKTDHKKLIFASSSSVYGNNEKVPFSEDDPVDFPISPYAASKKASEELCYTYHYLYGFDIFALRFFSVYGPRQRPDMAISKFFDSFLRQKPITMYGDGSSRRDYTFIEDITDGILEAIKKCSGYEVINLGESKTISLKNLLEEIKIVVNKDTEILSLPMQPGDVFQTNADISKAKKLLGYSPTVDIKSGLRKYFEYLASFNY